ncbi:LysR family transcriptional regulator [Rarobacter incanus]|uniref:DNA-binding transcriptional LysR family regulator n=1 Tax=Rarobacter incanus TaxID=153494 RepID=A0A542SMY8_9MICO|nr:LysR family transcriptional regulator [Rarobacter incanus]TQK75990.1 DNA-binding transcriptional LysR family regulator [Rarobacter incanus]
MSKSLELPHLRSLVAVADHGGFSRAATALHVSQSTISQHVRSLERATNAAVVEKQGRNARFTTHGQRLLTEARNILAVHDEALGRLTAAAAPTLVIGATDTGSDHLLATTLRALHSAYPHRAIQVIVDRPAAIAAAAARGTIDLAVGLGFPGDFAQPTGTVALRWYQSAYTPPRRGKDPTDGRQIGAEPPGIQAADETVVGADPQSEPTAGSLALATAPRASIALVTHFEPCSIRRLAVAALSAAGYAIEFTAESATSVGVIAAARAGLGVAVLPATERIPTGLEPVESLPPLGEISLYLQIREGLDPAIAATVRSAISGTLSKSANFTDLGERRGVASQTV